MPEPLAEGWLIILVVAFIPTIIAVAKGVASRWKQPLTELERDNTLLKKEAVERTDALTEAKVRRMFLEARLEYCESELDNWRSGKWSAGSQGGSS